MPEYVVGWFVWWTFPHQEWAAFCHELTPLAPSSEMLPKGCSKLGNADDLSNPLLSYLWSDQIRNHKLKHIINQWFHQASRPPWDSGSRSHLFAKAVPCQTNIQCSVWTLDVECKPINQLVSEVTTQIIIKSSNCSIACFRSVGWNPSVSAVLVTRKASSWASAIAARVLSMPSHHVFFVGVLQFLWERKHEEPIALKHKPGNKASSTLHDSKEFFCSLALSLDKD